MTLTNNRQMLREATAPLHEALHVHPVLKPLMADDLTLPLYLRALCAFATAYERAEAALPKQKREETPVLTWLRNDFIHHRQPWPEAVPSDFPLTLDSEPKLLGYLYVKQGSAMGGQLISRALQKSLGLVPGVDNHFFYGNGKVQTEQWQALLTAIERLNEAELNEAVEAALTTFRWITSCCNHVNEHYEQ